jgi:hypothetical protein
MSQAVLDRKLNDCLRVEMTWPEVAQGLTKIMIGYGVWVGGTLFGLLLVLMPLLEVGFKLETRLRIGQLWCFYAGLGLLSVIGIISCGIIMAGKWKCALAASERNGCRWWMFACMTSLGLAVGLSILSSLAGLKVKPEFSRGVAGLWQIRYTTAGVIFNVASLALSMFYTCSFAMFLRAVARCMDSRWHIRMVDLFMAFFVPLSLASGYLTYKVVTGDRSVIKLFLLVGVGWILCLIFWFVMIALVRSCIRNTVGRVLDPMAYSGVTTERKRDFSFG